MLNFSYLKITISAEMTMANYLYGKILTKIWQVAN